MKWRGLSTDSAEHQAPITSLRDKLLEIRAGIAEYVRPENQAINDRVVEELRAAGMASRILPVGAKAPEFILPDQNGKAVSSTDLLAKGPLVVDFFRGRWCPFCMTELEAWRDAAPITDAVGASVVAISPQQVRHNFFAADQHKLRFPVLCDQGNAVARAFGLAYDVPEYQKSLYKTVFVNLEHLNGMKYEEWSLPLPATYVIASDGTVLYAWASPDYKHRAEPSEALSCLPR
ncbi:MAG: AhpC/TSA family protein [Acidobacteriales bacterium]|nr:AhpC/TSA family protein [Terriglobales bacterium]